MKTRAAGLAVLFGLSATTWGCRSAAPSPYAPTEERSRCTVEAERLNREGAEVAEKDPAKAEKVFRESLTKDLFYGPAHNNLGVLYLKQEKLYEAANEFEWARKLMPGHPDPRVNLALTLERAGKIEDALASFRAALEVYPDYLPAIEGIASLTLRAGKKDEHLAAWLDAIAMRAETPAWREWALRLATASLTDETPMQVTPASWQARSNRPRTPGSSATARTRISSILPMPACSGPTAREFTVGTQSHSGTHAVLNSERNRSSCGEKTGGALAESYPTELAFKNGKWERVWTPVPEVGLITSPWQTTPSTETSSPASPPSSTNCRSS